MKIFRRFLLWVSCLLLALFVLSLLQVVALRWIPVYYTPLMAMRQWENRHDDKWKTQHKWVSLKKISPKMSFAVIASEDNRFESHSGFDWIEIDKVLHKEKRKKPRGASTISQQVAKNVFLWPGRSWIRKGLEAYYTVLIEFFWGKERIMEVYLNVAEMGKGIYGVEAAAQFYYKMPAAKLAADQAAMLAACLPNPLLRNPIRPSAYLRQRQQQIMLLMQKIATPNFYIN